MTIKENIKSVRKNISKNVTLISVSKTKPNEAIIEAYEAGERLFGENKAQEIIKKQPELPQDIQWHFIGHLQTNKVKYLTPFVSLFHSIDRAKLLKTINSEAKKSNRIVDCLLQFHIAEETTKFGLDIKEANELLKSDTYSAMENIRIIGVMGMATFTDNTDQVRREFRILKNIFTDLKKNFFADDSSFKEVSMGMSGDYKIAIEEGSTMVRVGSSIFGSRY
ncbi:MAG: YggS family pyridoxal phosphate-dependent enzyme [Bacteroidota bacterium]|nr:YggS family pyridoxal phosphate-dependent enzyme [Bacteroidota bacterium]